MFRHLVARALHPFKRAALWLTGERERRAQMDQIAVRLDRLAATLQTEAALRAENATLLSGLYGKADRLHADLYVLNEKVDHLHIRFASLSESSTALTGPTVRGEIDRLDGYLLYHTEQLQSALQALKRQSSCLADEAAERLTGELDRLDGGILHHFAVLRAQLGTRLISSQEGSTPVPPALGSNDG
jgi:hypothetical protein